VVVAGCLPAACKQIASEFPKFCFIGVNVQDVVQAVEAVERGSKFVLITSPEMKVCKPKNRLNPFVEIVPIAEGCLGNCSYCITKAARGRLKSFAGEKIVSHVKSALSEGVKEIWLTAQDTGAYGLDIKVSLPELLGEIVKIPGDFKVRVGMMNPNHILKFTEDLLAVFASEKIYKFLHLPVQSGSNRILKDMGRKYAAEDFREIACKFRKKLGTTLSTDIIVGYPTETEEEFKQTLQLIEETQPDIVNISRFWPRPGTKAACLKQHPGWLTKKRSRQANEVFKKIGLMQNKKWVGWRGNALVSEKNKDGSYTARNQEYKPIIVKSNKNLMGKTIKVVVKKATYYDLRGELV
jgi:MiaB-like tRNA modifying enzyme